MIKIFAKPLSANRAKKEKSYSFFQKLVEQELKIILEPEYKFHPVRKWLFDFADPITKTAIEIEGGVWGKKKSRHTTGSGFVADCEKYNNAALLGWKVLRFTPDQLLKTETLEIIRKAIKD